ncbi:hypothetical protein PINS_up000325 [Pythium insidiosum]|nr:hypothetical protein PINS_up000325 [Pythium insidiosum]
MCGSIWASLLRPIQAVLTDSRTSKSAVGTVVLCGGSARDPHVQAIVREYFDPLTQIIYRVKDGDVTLQARGAAIIGLSSTAGSSKGPCIQFQDVTPLALGVQRVGLKDISLVVPRNSAIPTTGTAVVFASCHADIKFRVVEAWNLIRSAVNRKDWEDGVHYLGTLDIGKSEAAQLLAKINVTLDVDETDTIIARAVEMTTGKELVLELCGDESLRLTRDAITRAHQYVNSKAAVTMSKDVYSTLAPAKRSMPVSNEKPVEQDRELLCIQRLEQQINENKLEIVLHAHDKKALLLKLASIRAYTQAREHRVDDPNRAPNGGDTMDQSGDSDAGALLELRALRRLVLSVIVSTAASELCSLEGNGIIAA